MRYPEFLQNDNAIGVIAPSDGVVKGYKINRLNNAIKRFENEYNYKVIEGRNIRTSDKGRSASDKDRAIELNDMYSNEDVKYISCVAGGDFLIEMLPYVDYTNISNNLKWIQGYSDPTALLFIITTKLDIATIYGTNFCSFGMKNLDESLRKNIDILEGKNMIQTSFENYQETEIEYITGLEEYGADGIVCWKNLNDEEEICLEGRIIGGCTDVLTNIIGTKYDYVKEFISRYPDDKFIWYFDNYEINSDSIVRTIFQFKEAGWFKNISGIVFGRNLSEASYYDVTFKDAIKHATKDLDVQVILDADIGHKPPQLTIVNGSKVIIKSTNGKGTIETIFN